MEAAEPSRVRHRVVGVAGRASQPKSGYESTCAEADCIRAVSAYEAAAEILAAPTLCLVVDLGLLGGADLRLLKIARRMELPVFGTGKLPAGMQAEDLAGVTLVARDSLGEAIAKLVRSIEGQYIPVEPNPQGPANEETTETSEAATDSPQSLLSSEELSALLEDED